MRLVLIGPNQQENLALQYLAAAAERAGHWVEQVAYNHRDDLVRTVEETLKLAPDLVGLGIAFQYAIDDYVALAQALRDHGYAGHLTCGGHVPTFCYEDLLRDAPALDSAVRHDGEETVVAMLARMAKGEPLRELPGLVWREGTALRVGPARPLAELDQLPWPRRAAGPYRVAGIPIAFLITARGCVGECSYCSIRAFTRSAGGPAYRTRSVGAVADEVAALHKNQKIPVFFVQDDLFILTRESLAVERIRSLTLALRERGVNDVAFWIKGRPESITVPVLEAARELGTLHIFLGVESACAERLAYLGRLHRPPDNRRAIQLCRDHGILPSFNLMLFDPDCTLSQIGQTLSFMDEVLDLPINLCRTEIYAGTPLLSRLQQQDRLLGDYRSYGYRMQDPRAELMFRVLRICLHEHAFAFDSLLNRLISLSFARQIQRHFLPGPATQDLAQQVQELLLETHRDTLSVLWQVHRFASEVRLDDAASVTRFATDLGLDLAERDATRHALAERLWTRANVLGMARFPEPTAVRDQVAPR